MTLSDVAPLVAVFLGGTGVLGGIYALLKLRPEAGQMTVLAAQGAVVAQTGVIDTLRVEMTRVTARLDTLEDERRRLTLEADRLRTENLVLRERVVHLEEELTRMRRIMTAQAKATSALHKDPLEADETLRIAEQFAQEEE